MRVFVTGTGRCGTQTFAMACRHVTNYTSGHETHRGRIGDLDYPEQHIEVDPHLMYVLALVRAKYPTALWVHVWRERLAVIRSIARRPSMAAYARFCFQARPDGRAAAEVLYDETHAMLRQLVPEAMNIRIERAAEDWPAFWSRIGAEGDCEAAVAELGKRYNAS